MCWTAERSFVGGARMPSAARHFVGTQLAQALGPVGDAEVIYDAELLVSELATNAVRCGAASVHVALQLHRGELEVEVTDDGAGWPKLVRPGEHDPHGRGLILIDSLADRWRAERIDSTRKRVCVTIVVPADYTRSLDCDRPEARALEREG